jgi:hypothetical protein
MRREAIILRPPFHPIGDALGPSIFASTEIFIPAINFLMTHSLASARYRRQPVDATRRLAVVRLAPGAEPRE